MSSSVLQPSSIQDAAEFLVQRRQRGEKTPRLSPALRPTSTEQAWLIQQALANQMHDSIGGWKCALPFDDKIVVAPIFSKTIFQQSPCPIHIEDGLCKIEPEIGFSFKADLPSRKDVNHAIVPYQEHEIIRALDSAHLALEFIQNRYLPNEEVPFIEHLADCLFNQGMFIGPAIPFDKAFEAAKIEFTLQQQQTQSIAGKHPNQLPQKPLFWLVNFLNAQGIDIKAGQVVITGSYAGLLKVLPNEVFTLTYQNLGYLNLQLTPA